MAASTSLANIGFRRWGREVTGALSSATEISKGIKEQEPKPVFEVENTSGNSHSTSTSYSMAGGFLARVMQVKRNLPQVVRQSGPDLQERRTLDRVQSFQ